MQSCDTCIASLEDTDAVVILHSFPSLLPFRLHARAWERACGDIRADYTQYQLQAPPPPMQAKEVQEELAMDMKILEQMLSESSNEAMQHLQRKVGH